MEVPRSGLTWLEVVELAKSSIPYRATSERTRTLSSVAEKAKGATFFLLTFDRQKTI